MFSFQSLSIHVYLLSQIWTILEMFSYMLSRMWKLSRGWVERTIFFPLSHMCMHIIFNCICNRGLLGIIWNRHGVKKVYVEELSAQMKRQRGKCGPFFHAYGHKIYTQKQSILIYWRTLYILCYIEVKVTRFNTEKRYSNLISLYNTLATYARVCKLEGKPRLLPWQKGSVSGGTYHRVWGVKCGGCVHNKAAGANESMWHPVARGRITQKHWACTIPCLTVERLTWQNSLVIKVKGTLLVFTGWFGLKVCQVHLDLFTLVGEIKFDLHIGHTRVYIFFFLITQPICLTKYNELVIITIDEKCLSQFSSWLFLLY